jgi:hypothetical protein
VRTGISSSCAKKIAFISFGTSFAKRGNSAFTLDRHRRGTTARAIRGAKWDCVVDLKDQNIRFQICDIYLPEPQQILSALFGHKHLHGGVVDVIGGGETESTYAVVRVERLREPIVIAVDRIEVVP